MSSPSKSRAFVRELEVHGETGSLYTGPARHKRSGKLIQSRQTTQLTAGIFPPPAALTTAAVSEASKEGVTPVPGSFQSPNTSSKPSTNKSNMSASRRNRNGASGSRGAPAGVGEEILIWEAAQVCHKQLAKIENEARVLSQKIVDTEAGIVQMKKAQPPKRMSIDVLYLVEALILTFVRRCRTYSSRD